MLTRKDMLLDQIRRQSEREAAHLAGEFARAASEEKEQILAAFEIEKWLAESCSAVLEHSEMLK